MLLKKLELLTGLMIKKMRKSNIQLLEKNGWDVVCENPFELEMWSDDKMVMIGEAKGYAAELILENCKEKWLEQEKRRLKLEK